MGYYDIELDLRPLRIPKVEMKPIMVTIFSQTSVIDSDRKYKSFFPQAMEIFLSPSFKITDYTVTMRVMDKAP